MINEEAIKYLKEVQSHIDLEMGGYTQETYDAIDMAIGKLQVNDEQVTGECTAIDKYEIKNAVHILDLFTKIFCRYSNDYERFNDLKFRCEECPFYKENGDCLCRVFKNKYAPDYKDFGSMGDL